MARTTKTTVVITDDMDNSILEEGAVTEVTIIIGGEGITLDLGEKSLKQFETAVSKFTKDRPRVTMTTPRRAANRQSKFPDGYLKAVREWAAEQGITVPRVGVVPKSVLAQYEDAKAS